MSDDESFYTDIGTGMERVERDGEDALDDPVLLARLKEYESVRNRGAVEARTAWLG